MKTSKLKVGYTAKVISGEFFGKVGKIIKIDKKKQKVYLNEIFREKFLKDQSGKDFKDDSIYADSVLNKNKKKVFIPIDISNLKSFVLEDLEEEKKVS